MASDKKEQKRYEEELFKKLSNSLVLREEESLLGQYFGEPIWWMIQALDKNGAITAKDIENHCQTASLAHKEGKTCLNELSDVFNRAKKTKKAQFFTCPFGLFGFCYPIVQGKKIYGYIAMCHVQKEIPRFAADMFINFLNTLVREMQKELQLAKLYETIRPRAIALSTVHTVHRLLTSTLDLDELLPRIARLSLQIVRANRCSIKLVDKAKKVLLPKTTVDQRKKNVKLKKVKVGMYAPGKAFKKGRVVMGKDYMAIPMIDKDVIGVITLYDKIDGKAFSEFDREIMSTLAEQAVIAINNALLYKDQEKMTEGIIKSLSALLNTQAFGILTPRMPFVKIALEIGKILRLSREDLKSLEYAYMIHDVGKAALPESLLSKRRKLTDSEYKLIKGHTNMAASILKPLKALKASVPMIRHQRERYDGKGYPDKLKGKKIPPGARIMSVTSAFEAMAAKRPYQVKKTLEKAIEEIKKNSGTQFDPKVVEAFLKVVNKRRVKIMLRRERYGS